MRAQRRRFDRFATLASLLALALLAAPQARAHDDDDDWDGDDGYYYDDDRYDRGSHGDWCSYGHCNHSAAIPHFDSLDPYGAWRYVPAFGAHLWFPWVDRSWRPYFYGHWVSTTFGMTWVSHEPWGEIPHHYGNWVYVAPFGWGWVPGWDYSPAWVTWGVSDGYVGWAPCPPRGYRYPRFRRYHSTVHVSWYGHRDPYGYHDSGLDFSFWIFVGNRDFYGQPVYRHALARPNSLSLWKTKRVQTVGTRLNVASVQTVTREKISTVSLDRVKRDVGGRKLEVYSPRDQKEFIRSGESVAKRSYVKPVGVDRKESAARVDRPESPSSVKSRADRPESVKRTGGDGRKPEPADRAKSDKSRQVAASRVESAKPRREEPQRAENDKPRREEPQRVENTKPRRSEPPARRGKVEKVESRAPDREKAADKPAGKSPSKSAGKSKPRPEQPTEKSGKKSGK
jgi:hypothetical protein